VTAWLQITLREKRRCGINRVLGFGGFFFRANDPDKLATWYRDHLGINPAPQDMEMKPWVTDSGVTVFSPFAADTDYFTADKAFMLNFRVANLAAIVRQLKMAGIEVSHQSEMAGIGRFARIHDPEGNPVELWEPES
jgi:predicted enzyme related to lactoylglutathione lyase